jgi:hypothetical protein
MLVAMLPLTVLVAAVRVRSMAAALAPTALEAWRALAA